MDKKSFKNTIKDMPLSLPMGVAALGTAASAWFANKGCMLCVVWYGWECRQYIPGSITKR